MNGIIAPTADGSYKSCITGDGGLCLLFDKTKSYCEMKGSVAECKGTPDEMKLTFDETSRQLVGGKQPYYVIMPQHSCRARA